MHQQTQQSIFFINVSVCAGELDTETGSPEHALSTVKHLYSECPAIFWNEKADDPTRTGSCRRRNKRAFSGDTIQQTFILGSLPGALDGCPADIQCLHQFPFSRQPVMRLEQSVLDLVAKLIQKLQMKWQRAFM